MIREVDLVSYLPPFLQEYKEQKNTLMAENLEFSIVWGAVDSVMKNEFIETADEYGISRFEKMLGILPYAEDALESRRVRVQSRWFTSIPYTMKAVLAKLAILCGEDGVMVESDMNHYTLIVKLTLQNKGLKTEIEKLLDRVMPGNMFFKVTLIYNTNRILSAFSHRELSAFTHRQLKEEEMEA